MHQITLIHIYTHNIYILGSVIDIHIYTYVLILMSQQRMVYQQNWSAYDKSQITEKTKFIELLTDLLQNVEESEYGFGRPKIAMRDMLFASAFKVYTQVSLRRFMSDLENANKLGLITHTPCFASVGHFIQSKELTPILKMLIILSSLPLRLVEVKFAVDSTGFKTTKFGEYCKQKHKTNSYHKWLKAHVCCGVKTNIITAVEVSGENDNDSPYLDMLITTTHNNGFTISEVSADKGYTSQYNIDRIWQLGAIPFIPFKINTRTPEGGNTWSEMYGFFMQHQKEFMRHYHLRSNIETTFFMIKSKFNETLKGKTLTAQVNELLLKFLCHNIVVLIHETNELGINTELNNLPMRNLV